MRAINNLMHLGLFLSLIPEDEPVREFIFGDKVVPSRVHGLSPKLENSISLRFSFRSNAERFSYIAVWSPEANELTYHLHRHSGKCRIIDGMRWLIDVRTLMGDDRWEFRTLNNVAFLSRKFRNSWPQYWQNWQRLREGPSEPPES